MGGGVGRKDKANSVWLNQPTGTELENKVVVEIQLIIYLPLKL